MSISNIQGIFDKEATGNAVHLGNTTISVGSSTNATANSGGLRASFGGSLALGTTLPGTLVDVYPAGLTGNPLRAMYMNLTAASTGITHILVRVYKIGTVVFTSTGQKFTHDAATFPVLRTQMGTSQAVPLVPFIYMTAATTTTAAIYTLKYVNQDNATVTGARTFTMPSTATVVQSMYFQNLEDVLAVGGRRDTAVLDVTEVNVTTAAATGTADVWGMEVLGASCGYVTTQVINKNFVTQGFSMPDINPATATSGTVTSKLMLLSVGQASGITQFWWNMKAFVDN